MAGELTTRPMLEAILEGQRQFAVQLTSLLDAVAALSVKQDGLAARQEQFAARQEELAARQDRLELAVIELTREVRNGFDDTTRKIDVLNSRLLPFETRLKRIDDRLHDELLARTR
jgi:hypothetical protein